MAQALATVPSGAVVASSQRQDFVTFIVGNQLFGIPVLKVQDILKSEKIAKCSGSRSSRSRTF